MGANVITGDGIDGCGLGFSATDGGREGGLGGGALAETGRGGARGCLSVIEFAWNGANIGLVTTCMEP
jgi:hypothetical protein